MREFGGYESEPVEARLLTAEEASRVIVACAICGANLWPLQMGQAVKHDCETGEVTPA